MGGRLRLSVVVGAIAVPLVFGASLLHIARHRLGKACVGGLCADGRVQVNEEGDDVEGKDEGDDPLKDGGNVVVFGDAAGDKGDGEAEFDDNKGKLDPERDSKDTVLPMDWKGVSW
jgi:hypothetical protein